MRKSKTIQFNGKETTVNELTVAQVDSLMAEQNTSITTVEMLLNPNTPIGVVVASTGISSAELNGEVSPGELQKLWQAVEEMNPFLLQMYGRILAAAAAMDGEAAKKQATV